MRLKKLLQVARASLNVKVAKGVEDTKEVANAVKAVSVATDAVALIRNATASSTDQRNAVPVKAGVTTVTVLAKKEVAHVQDLAVTTSATTNICQSAISIAASHAMAKVIDRR